MSTLTPGVCRVCGCHAADCTRCVERTGEPCGWADRSQTLCTACAPLLKTELVKVGLRSGLTALALHGFRRVGDVLHPDAGFRAGASGSFSLPQWRRVASAVAAWLEYQLDHDTEGNELMPDDRWQP